MNEWRTVILGPALSRKELFTAIELHRVNASQDNDLKVTFTVNGEVMGSRLNKLSSGESATIEVKVEDADEFPSTYLIELFYDRGPKGRKASVVATQLIDDNASAKFTHKPFAGKGYYFARVTSKSGTNKNFKAWTAPVWFE